MYRVVICDESRHICSEIDHFILIYANENKLKIETDIFNNGENFCDFLEKEQVNLVFLELEMHTITGFDVADFIREVIHDNNTYIVFMSSKVSYAMKLFKYRPLDFLIKPICSKDIDRILNLVIELEENESKSFEYYKASHLFRIPFRDILYFQSENKKIIIKTTNGTDEFYGKLKDLYNRLIKQDFLYIHKSFIVNYNYITHYTYENVSLTNGEILNISRANRYDIRKKFRKLDLKN